MTAEGKALKEQYQWEARSQWKGTWVIIHTTLYVAAFKGFFAVIDALTTVTGK